jgi:hypothetical protein
MVSVLASGAVDRGLKPKTMKSVAKIYRIQKRGFRFVYEIENNNK